MRDSIFVVLALALFVGSPFSAAADGERVVDLDECIRLGFAHDAGLHVNELETSIADAKLREIQRQYMPSLSLQGGYSRLSELATSSLSSDVSFGGAPPMPVTITFPPYLDNSTSIRLELQQPLFTGMRIASSVRQAEALRDSSRGDLGRSRLDLRYSIAEAFWGLTRAKTQREAINQSVAQAESHLADARKLLDQGAATNNDVLQAEMRLEDARIELASAQNVLDIARVRLALLIGVPWDTALDVPDTPSQYVERPQESMADLVARALANRPEIQSARSQVSAQEAGLDVARAGLFPSVFITGDYTLANPNLRVFPQTNQFVGTWSIGLLASIDVGRYPQVLAQEEQAQSKLTQAQESSRQLADVVTTDVIRAYLTLSEAAGRLASLRQETAQAEENDRVTQERYRQGVALSSESLDAQTFVVNARLREDGALFDCLVAKAALARAVGE
jgi:outer membrane protein TolC